MDVWGRMAIDVLLKAHREYIARVLTIRRDGPTKNEARRATLVWLDCLAEYRRTARTIAKTPKPRSTRKGSTRAAFAKRHHRQLAELVMLFRIDRDLGLGEMRSPEK